MSELWREEDETLLRNLVARDLSASQIAARMPFECSRNAIISKLRRIGLKLHRGRSEQRKAKAYSAKASMRRLVEAPAVRVRQSKPHLPPHVPYVPREAAPTVPPTSFQDRRPGQCAWPVSNGQPWLFCGNDKQPGVRRSGRRREYCEAHELLGASRGSTL